MEGYSVTEAASVLGVPTERVWELLARGVLAGAPEGDTGMRVYLQPRPAPGPAPVEPASARANGGSGDESHELSPFRALLTEFRNLTERYGQALLALGESRGEVASLRSRVDMLEARIELRLPGAPTAQSWSAAGAAEPIERTITPPAAEEEPRHRSRGPRRATESFAEALARAEDPSPPELRAGFQARDAATEAALPRDLPAADSVPVADEVMPDAAEAAPVADETTPVDAEVEPMAEETVGSLDPDAAPVGEAGETEPIAAETASDAEPEVIGAEAVAAFEEPGVSEPVDEPEPAVAAAAAPEPAEAAAPSAEMEPMEQQVAAAAPPSAEPDDGAHDAEPLEWDAERYTTAIEEPDWLEAEAYEAPPNAVAEPDIDEAPEDEPIVEPSNPMPEESTESRPTPEVVADAPEPDVAAVDELEPAASAEVGDLPAFLEPEAPAAAELETAPTPPRHEPTAFGPLPGAADLDAALQALRRRTLDEDVAADPWRPASESGAPREPGSPRPFTSPVMPPRTGTPPITPAGRAYRRLRRIFPG